MKLVASDVLDLIDHAYCIHPMSEVFVTSDLITDWRLSYGVKTHTPTTIFFLSIYPPFCSTQKAQFHYNRLEKLVEALNEILATVGDTNQMADALGSIFAISRGKESFELFAEQRELLKLGLKHVFLDNFYQDTIKMLCAEYYESGKLMGYPLSMDTITGVKDA